MWLSPNSVLKRTVPSAGTVMRTVEEYEKKKEDAPMANGVIWQGISVILNIRLSVINL
jgi:hypothetical protein